MPDQELWDGEREQRWQIMERMEEDRAKRERNALASGRTGAAGEADYQRRLAEQGLTGDQVAPGQSDAGLAEDVRNRLLEDQVLAGSEVDVDAAAGEVTLRGKVESLQARQHAQLVAEQVGGVTRVTNLLKVR